MRYMVMWMSKFVCCKQTNEIAFHDKPDYDGQPGGTRQNTNP